MVRHSWNFIILKFSVKISSGSARHRNEQHYGYKENKIPNASSKYANKSPELSGSKNKPLHRLKTFRSCPNNSAGRLVCNQHRKFLNGSVDSSHRNPRYKV